MRVEPSGGAILCEIDPVLAIMAVERLLGGAAESLPEPRALSETEQGVLEYLFLQLLAGIHEASGPEASTQLRFDRLAFDDGHVRKLAPEDAVSATLVFRVIIGRHAGFVRASFIEPFAQEALFGASVPALAGPRARAEMRAKLAALSSLRAPLWAEAGRTTLLPADLRQLEEGDVILFELGDLRLSGGAKQGSAILRVGQGLSGGIDVDVELTEKRAACSVRGVHEGA